MNENVEEQAANSNSPTKIENDPNAEQRINFYLGRTELERENEKLKQQLAITKQKLISIEEEGLVNQLEKQKTEISQLINKFRESDIGDDLIELIKENEECNNTINNLTLNLSLSNEKEPDSDEMKTLNTQLKQEQEKQKGVEKTLQELKQNMSPEVLSDVEIVEVYVKDINNLQNKINELQKEHSLAKRQALEMKKQYLNMEIAHAEELRCLYDGYETRLKKVKENLKNVVENMNLTVEDQEKINDVKRDFENQLTKLNLEILKATKECTNAIICLREDYIKQNTENES